MVTICKADEHFWVAPVRHIQVAVGRIDGKEGGHGPIAAWAKATNRMPLINPQEHDPKKQRHISNEPEGDAVLCLYCKVTYAQHGRALQASARPVLSVYLDRSRELPPSTIAYRKS